MKMYIYHKNKGYFLIEYLVVSFMFLIFVPIIYIFLKNVHNTKKIINEDINEYEVNKILDRIAYKLKLDDEIKIENNMVKTKNFSLIFSKENELKVMSNKNIKKSYLFKYESYNIDKLGDRLEIRFKIKGQNFKRVLSLK